MPEPSDTNDDFWENSVIFWRRQIRSGKIMYAVFLFITTLAFFLAGMFGAQCWWPPMVVCFASAVVMGCLCIAVSTGLRTCKDNLDYAEKYIQRRRKL